MTAALLSKGAPLQCCFFNQHHLSGRCQVVRGSEERKQCLRRTGHCFLCLARGHLNRQCRSRSRCSGCNGRRHPSICGEVADFDLKSLGLKGVTPSSTFCDSRSSPSVNLNPEAAPFPKPSTSLLVVARGAVLLQTATVHAYNPDKLGCSIDIRAILNTGSQQSYASQCVNDALALKYCRKQTTSGMTFSSSDQVARACDVVRLGLVTKDGRRQERGLFVVPYICQPLTTQPIDFCVTKYKHLASLDLADTSSARASMDVDLLIGSGCYWTFVTGEIHVGKMPGLWLSIPHLDRSCWQ